MNKTIAIGMILIMGVMVVSPSMSYGSTFGRGNYNHVAMNNYGIHDRQAPRPYNNVRSVRSNDNNNALFIAGAALGGIVLGAIIAGVMSQPEQAPVKQAVYSAPLSGSSAYTQPYAYGTTYNQETPPGQWVTVQGQWVNGQWIPAHNVWMPINP